MPTGKPVKRAPPIAAIEAFLAATRAPSFRHAAERLAISPSALSRRIQALEHLAGVKLFDRSSPTPRLTAAGERCRRRLEPSYDTLRTLTDWLAAESDDRPLRVGLSQSLAVSWLLPRLNAFIESEDGIDLVLQTRSARIDLAGGAADVAILYGDGNWPGLTTQKLFDVTAVPVCAPDYRTRHQLPLTLAELVDERLMRSMQPRDVWEQWLRGAGWDGPLPRRYVSFDSVQVMYEASAQRLGIALGTRPLVDPFLADGRLVPAFDRAVRLPGAYYVAALPQLRRSPQVSRFWRWVVDQGASSAHAMPRAQDEHDVRAPGGVPSDAHG